MQIDLPSLPNQTRVYVVRPAVRMLASALAGFLLLAMPAIAVYLAFAKPSGLLFDGAEFLFVFINLLMPAGAALIYVSLVGSRLTISPDGIEFDTFGYRVASPWRNITGYGSVSTGRGMQEGLLLARAMTDAEFVTHKPVLDTLFFLLALVSGRYVGSMPDAGILKVVPVKMFDTEWESGEIGEQVRRYAPHLSPKPRWGTIPAPAQPSDERLAEVEQASAHQPPHHAPGVWATLRAYPGVALVPLGLCAALILMWGLVFYRLSGMLVKADATWDGHTSSVTSLAISADGRLLVSGSYDDTIRLWDTATGQSRVIANVNQARLIALSSDGRTIVAYGWTSSTSESEEEAAIRLWDVATENELTGLNPQYEEIEALAFSPDGQFLASISKPSGQVSGYTIIESPYASLQLWNIATREEIFALADLGDQPKALAFSPDSSTLAVGLENSDILLFDLSAPPERRTLNGNGRYASMEALAFTSSGNSLLQIEYDCVSVLWDIPSQQPVYHSSGSEQNLYKLAVSPDGTRFATGGGEKFITIGDTATFWPLKILRGHTRDVGVVVFSSDGTTLYSGGNDNRIKVWSLK